MQVNAMSNQETIDDLKYATALAKSNHEGPLVGGPIGLMWGILISATLFAQWCIITDIIGIEPQYLWLLWAGFTAVGCMGSAILGRKVGSKEGANSIANRIENAVWTMFGLMLSCMWVGIVISMLLGIGSVALFDLVPIVGFGGQGLAYGVIAKVSHHKWLGYAAGAAFVTSILCMQAFGQPELYLLAAIATLFTVVVPSLKSMGIEHAEQNYPNRC